MRKITYVRVKYYVYLFSQVSRCLKFRTAAACRKLSHANFSLHETRELRENYARIDWRSMATKIHASLSPCGKRDGVCTHSGEIWFCCRLTILNYLLGGPRRNICRGESAYSDARLPPPSACYVVRGWRRGGFVDALGLGWKWFIIGNESTAVLCTRGEISDVLKYILAVRAIERHFYWDSPFGIRIKWLFDEVRFTVKMPVLW